MLRFKTQRFKDLGGRESVETKRMYSVDGILNHSQLWR